MIIRDIIWHWYVETDCIAKTCYFTARGGRVNSRRDEIASQSLCSETPGHQHKIKIYTLYVMKPSTRAMDGSFQVPPASASYRLSDVDDCLSCNKDYSLVNDNKESAKLLMDADESLSFHLTAMKRSRGMLLCQAKITAMLFLRCCTRIVEAVTTQPAGVVMRRPPTETLFGRLFCSAQYVRIIEQQCWRRGRYYNLKAA